MDFAKFTPRVKSACRIRCVVKDCESRIHKNLDIVFHRFPPANKRFVTITNKLGNCEKVDILVAWKRALKINKINSSMKVCSRHFKTADYILPDSPAKKRILKKNSVPSNNLPGGLINVDKSRENRLINRHKRKENVIAEQILIEDSVQEDFTERTAKEEYHCKEPTKDDHLAPNMLSVHHVEVQVATDFLKPKFSDFIKTDSELSTLTGLESFQILHKIVDVVSSTFGHKLMHSTIKMSIFDKVIMVYIKLKQNLSYCCLAILFNCYSSKHCEGVFKDMIEILSESLKVVIKWPSKEVRSKNLPQCFQGFEDVQVVLDCTEIFIQSSKNLCCQLLTYPDYKKSQTVKFMTGVTPSGNICYISKAYDGRSSDKVIFESSDIIKLLKAGDGIMVDKGFLIEEICLKNGWKCHRPPFLIEKKQFSKADALLTCRIAKARVHVERSIQRIKTFKIVGEKITTNMLPYVEDIFTVVCAAVNLNSLIIGDDKFMQK